MTFYVIKLTVVKTQEWSFMILNKSSFVSLSKTSTALFTTRSTSMSSSWLKGTSCRNCLRRLWRNLALDSFSWVAKDLIWSGDTWLSEVKITKMIVMQGFKWQIQNIKMCNINVAHYWPLAVFIASEIRRRQVWSAWWTRLVAHFWRSASCTEWDKKKKKKKANNSLM